MVLDSLTLADAAKDLRFLVMTLWWDDSEKGRANHLFGSIAKETLCPLVPASDDAVEILADNGVVGALDDGGKESGGAQSRVRLLTSIGFREGDIDRRLAG